MSLLDLLKKGIHDVGGAANTAVRAATPLPAAQPTRPTIQQRPKPVVQTPGPAIQVQQPRINPIQQLHIQQPQIPQMNTRPVQQPVMKPVQVARPQPLQVGAKTVPIGGAVTNARPAVQQNASERFLASKPGTIGLGAARSLAGTGQAVSGLVDLASPGLGTNRFSKTADVAAKQIDQSAANSNKALYRGAQAGTDLATFAIGGGAAKALPGVARLGQANSVITRPVTAYADRLAQGGIKSRIAGQTLRGATNPNLLAANAGQQAFYTGQQASRGENVNPVEQLAQFAAGQVGLPLAGAALREGTAPVVKAGLNTLRDTHLIAPSRLNDNEVAALHYFNQSRGSYDMQDGNTYEAGLAAAQKAGIDANNPQAIDDLVNAHLNHATQVQQRMEALQGLGQRMQVQNEGGFIAGPRASGFLGAKQNGRLFDGVDGKPRFEVSDESAKLKGDIGYQTPVGDVLDHPQLYSQYPELRNTKVTKVASNTSSYDPDTGNIEIGAYAKSPKGALLHELQHAIQKHENFAAGGSPNPTVNIPAINKQINELTYSSDPKAAEAIRALMKVRDELSPGEQYGRLAGEAEARAVEKRMNMKGSERYVNRNADDYIKKSGTKAVYSNTYKGLFDGQPAKLYRSGESVHGHIGKKDGVAWFADEYSALSYSPSRDKSSLKEAYLDVKNPLDLTKNHDLMTQITGTDSILSMSGEQRAKILKYAKDNGYDSVKMPDTDGGGKNQIESWAVWDKKNIVPTKEKPKPKSTFYDDLDVPKDQLIVKTGDSGVVNGKAMSIEPGAATKSDKPSLPKATPQPRTPLLQDNKVSSLGKNTPIVQNSLTKGAKANRQNLSPETVKQVSGEHAQRSTKALNEQSIANAGRMNDDKLIATTHEKLAVKAGAIDDDTVALANQAIERAERAGRTADAVSIHDALSEHLVKQGQTIQAASLLYRLSPQGLLYKGMRDIKKGGATMTPELEAKLRSVADTIKTAPNKGIKQRATAEFHKLVADNIPQSNVQNALSVWKAGLLSGAKTQTGNFLSNGTFGVLKKVSDIPAAAIDKGLSLATGQRTKTVTARGIGSGAKEGIKSGISTMKTGIDVRNIEGDKYEIRGEINFKNPVIQKVFGKPSNLVFRGMSAADQPFYYAALKNNLADVAKADGVNKGLKGQALEDHIVKTMANPTTKMAETAKLAAQKSVLSQDNKIASSISKIAREHPALQAIVPFVKVPTNFLARTLDYTPVGAVKEVVKQARSGKLEQRALSEALAEATTGSAIIAIGAELANNRLLSGQYPTGDQKEAQRWKAEGIQPNSVKIGGKWVSLNYLGPAGLLLGAGKDYHNAASQGDNGAMQAVAGLGKGLAGQSFLTGFSGAANAINDPGRYGANFVHSQVASIVPAWLNDAANATDSKQRETADTAASVAARLPGVRASLPVKNDVYGNSLDQRTNPVDLTVDPLKPSKAMTNKNAVVAEVSRLHGVDPNNKDLQVTPTPVTSLNVEGKPIKLNDKQKYEIQKQVGQSIQTNWDKLIKTSEYKALSDVDKASALEGVRKDSTTLAERTYVVNNNLGTYAKSPSQKVQGLGTGEANLADYASSTQNAGAGNVSINKAVAPNSKTFLTKYNAMSTAQRKKAADTQNDFEYNKLVAEYDNNKARKSLSVAEDIKAKNAIDKALVGKDFTKEVRDLYNSQISKGDLYDYLSTAESGKDKKALAAQLIKYGDAIHDKLGTKSKFRTSKGALAFSASDSKKSGSKKKSSGGKGSKTVVNSSISYSGTAKSGVTNGLKQRKFAQPRGHVALQKISTGDSKTKGKTQKRVFA